jgi:hypothetical protein
MTPAQKRDMEIRGKRVGHAPDLLRSARARNYRRPRDDAPPPPFPPAYARASLKRPVCHAVVPHIFHHLSPFHPIFRKTNSMARSLT